MPEPSFSKPHGQATMQAQVQHICGSGCVAQGVATTALSTQDLPAVTQADVRLLLQQALIQIQLVM